MRRTLVSLVALVLAAPLLYSQAPKKAAGNAGEAWVRATLRSMTIEDKVGQVMWDRADGRFLSETDERFLKMKDRIQKLHLGGYVIFAGTPHDTAALLNALQRSAKIPLLIGADFERGPAMRIPVASEIPDNMAIGATRDPRNAAFAAEVTAREARAMGVQWTYSPDADVNNNPDNPIINTRSYGEDPEAVARMVAAYVQAAEKNGVIATAKHFPGHGDTATDSHIELGIVSGDLNRLDNVELVPFRAAIRAGVSSIMTAHLSVPAVEPDPNLPATLSRNVLTGLLREKLEFRGLIATDALEMGGVTRNYWVGEIAVRAFEAGADCLLLPTDPETAHRALLAAVKSGRISRQRLDQSVERILRAKAKVGLHRRRLVDLNKVGAVVADAKVRARIEQIANQSITLVRDEKSLLPSALGGRKKLAVLLFTADPTRAGDAFLSEIRQRAEDAQVLIVPPNITEARAREVAERAAAAGTMVAGLFIRAVSFKGTVGMPEPQAKLMKQLAASGKPLVAISFGNPYLIRAFPEVGTYLCAFSVADASERAGVRAIFGEIPITGRLPVTIPGIAPLGGGLERAAAEDRLKNETAGQEARFAPVFELVREYVSKKTFPGAVIAIGHKGALVAMKAFGKFDYAGNAAEVTPETIYDIASVSKVVGTTTAAMILYERKDLLLDLPVVRYIPEFAGPYQHDIITVRQLLTHTSGLPPHEDLFLNYKGKAQILDQMCKMPLAAAPGQKFAYSDFGLMLAGEIIERITGQRLDQFLKESLFAPLAMNDTLYNPGPELLPRIPPTEQDPWRNRVVRGEVHDENCAAYGGVCGHAGLFSTAADLAVFAQMLLNGGVYGGKRIVKRSALDAFTAKQETPPGSARGLGWDKPGSSYWHGGDLMSPASFGHTGFTGTSIAVDPEKQLFVILLTNRVHPTRENNAIVQARRVIHTAVVEAIQ